MPVSADEAGRRLAAWQERQRVEAAEARAAREAEAQRPKTEPRTRATPKARKAPTRRGYRPTSAQTKARQSQAVRAHRFAVALTAGTASPLAIARNARKLTQPQLALAAGVPRRLLQHAEAGHTVPDEVWTALSEALAVPVEQLRP